MNENLKAFLQKASEDSELQEKMMEMNESLCEDAKKRFIRLAEENGFAFAEADIDELYVEIGEVSEDELKAVSGGAYTERNPKSGLPCSACYCPFVGSGSEDQYQKKCFCFMGGAGELTDEGKKQVKMGKIDYCGRRDTPVALWCVLAGNGYM